MTTLATQIVSWWTDAASGVKTLPGPYLGLQPPKATPPYAIMHSSGGRLHLYFDRSFTKPEMVRFDIIAPEASFVSWQTALHTRFDLAAIPVSGTNSVLQCVRENDYTLFKGYAKDQTALYQATSLYRIVCENTF
jgi:hypothetical protein